MILTRREAIAGIGATLAISPAARLLAAPLAGFTHGVASGEPTTRSILLWTRYVGRGDAQPLRAELSDRADFSRIVKRSTALAEAANDWTARTALDGIEPGKRYYYRFIAPDGSRSEIGRTATLPAGPDAKLILAVLSCANLPFGWFNAYAHAAHSDADVAVHLGDYLYEYQRGVYPRPEATVPGRVHEPANHLFSLADYRTRYASYRLDADLRALHAAKPWLAVWDDHEFADNARPDGSLDHDPSANGPWETRKAAARKAWLEWMPVSRDGWGSRDAGDLASLIQLETRVTGRTASPDIDTVVTQPGADAAKVAAFERDQWLRDDRRILGEAQEQWLLGEIAASAKRTRWQVIIQSVPMGMCVVPPEAPTWKMPWGEAAEKEIGFLVEAGRQGVPFNMDNWNGFPAQRARILRAMAEAKARPIVLSGDSHNAWSYRLQHDGRPVALELAVPSVTTPGFENWFKGEDPARVSRGLVAANPELLWCDTSQRGYGRLVLTSQKARLEWLMTDPVRSRSPGAILVHSTEQPI